jgi:hypothetical protein
MLRRLLTSQRQFISLDFMVSSPESVVTVPQTNHFGAQCQVIGTPSQRSKYVIFVTMQVRLTV